MQKVILSLLFLSVLFARGQNLIQNPGFEEFTGRPASGHLPVNASRHWYCPNFSGTDYFVRINGAGEGVPKNDFGLQHPHSGNAYAGICIHKEYIEYVGTKLSATLVAGKSYRVEFFISRAEKSVAAVNEFGVLFTEKPYKTLDKRGFVVQPSVTFSDPSGFKEEKEWVHLSQIYVAEGFESYLTLGHFIYRHPAGVRQFSHYYIDDVSVTLIDEDEGRQSSESIPVEDTPERVAPVFAPSPQAPVVLENVFFETAKSGLKPESFPELDKLVTFLTENPGLNITLKGYTDDLGTEENNKDLSLARAKAVSDYLVRKGIESSRVDYYGLGSQQPVATNLTEEGRQRNRRVEFTVTRK